MRAEAFRVHERRRHMRMAMRCGRVAFVCFFAAGYVLPHGKHAGAALLIVLGLACLVHAAQEARAERALR